MTSSDAFLDAVRVEVATLQAQHPVLADVLSRAHVLLVEGRVWVEEDGQHAMVHSSDGTRWYHVNASCPCDAAHFNKEAPCKHRTAVRVYARVVQRLLDDNECYTLTTPDVETPASPPAGIDPTHVVMIQGKPFVKFTGLLQMAHQRGLVALTADWTFNDAELSLAHAVATFQDGRRFEESGDATPANVHRNVAPAWRRMSLTRAKARVLRDALGVDLIAVEELADRGEA